MTVKQLDAKLICKQRCVFEVRKSTFIGSYLVIVIALGVLGYEVTDAADANEAENTEPSMDVKRLEKDQTSTIGKTDKFVMN